VLTQDEIDQLSDWLQGRTPHTNPDCGCIDCMIRRGELGPDGRRREPRPPEPQPEGGYGPVGRNRS
jgi:hypothetical protein